MTSAYLFEKSVCEKCRDHSLSRIARAIDSGSILPDPSHPANRVDYLIFELADGDIRSHLDTQISLDVVFALRTLHHVATGLQQLHTAQIAHQDLKPSNVLVFPGVIGSKVSDLGRAWAKDLPAPHDGLEVAGDQGYAPPEILYGEIATDANTRRFGCDMFHLGSLVVFFFTRVHMNALLTKHLAPEHRPVWWRATYKEVLPYVQAAFALALDEIESSIQTPIRSEMREMITQLCNPNPARRGHPLSRGSGKSQFELKRYVSQFDLLAYKVRSAITRGDM